MRAAKLIKRPREVVEPSSLETVKTQQDKALNNLAGWIHSEWEAQLLQRSLPTEVILCFYLKLLEGYKNSQRAQLSVCEKLQYCKSKKDDKINMVPPSSCRLGMLLQIHESPRGILLLNVL